ncbi:hypothetical protein Baya_16940 [Bagarius yarrelli]|uniref:Uncharacterized protein n=1 Tax=Bagarius yarrelli TaxID=175774 RepID=A0A556VWY1_BAGYA|nr:hypothetical protein Baya_16940 [Bagarius yarrelli]
MDTSLFVLDVADRERLQCREGSESGYRCQIRTEQNGDDPDASRVQKGPLRRIQGFWEPNRRGLRRHHVNTVPS